MRILAQDQLQRVNAQKAQLEGENAALREGSREAEAMRRRIDELTAEAAAFRRISTSVPDDLVEAIRLRIAAERVKRVEKQRTDPLTFIAPGDLRGRECELEAAAVAFIGEEARGSIRDVKYAPEYQGGSTYVRVVGATAWMRYHAAVLRARGWLAVPIADVPQHDAGRAVIQWARAHALHCPNQYHQIGEPPYIAQNVSFTDAQGHMHMLGMLGTVAAEGLVPMTRYFVGANEHDTYSRFKVWAADHGIVAR